jgi:hypothetical protein
MQVFFLIKFIACGGASSKGLQEHAFERDPKHIAICNDRISTNEYGHDRNMYFSRAGKEKAIIFFFHCVRAGLPEGISGWQRQKIFPENYDRPRKFLMILRFLCKLAITSSRGEKHSHHLLCHDQFRCMIGMQA